MGMKTNEIPQKRVPGRTYPVLVIPDGALQAVQHHANGVTRGVLFSIVLESVPGRNLASLGQAKGTGCCYAKTETDKKHSARTTEQAKKHSVARSEDKHTHTTTTTTIPES